jgi:hypothetical protein
MFAARFFPSRYFADTYWAKVGADAVTTAIAMCGDVEVLTAHFALLAVAAAHLADAEVGTALQGRVTADCPAS